MKAPRYFVLRFTVDRARCWRRDVKVGILCTFWLVMFFLSSIKVSLGSLQFVCVVLWSYTVPYLWFRISIAAERSIVNHSDDGSPLLRVTLTFHRGQRLGAEVRAERWGLYFIFRVRILCTPRLYWWCWPFLPIKVTREARVLYVCLFVLWSHVVLYLWFRIRSSLQR